MRLLLLGCTGLVGRELIPMLLEQGHQLTVVSRQPRGAGFAPLPATLNWLQLDPAQARSWTVDGALHAALSVAEGVVNLAGEPIAEQRWTPVHLKLLEASRLLTTRHLVQAMATLDRPPSVLVNASAVGYYGTSADATFGESSPPGGDVLARLGEPDTVLPETRNRGPPGTVCQTPDPTTGRPWYTPGRPVTVSS